LKVLTVPRVEKTGAKGVIVVAKEILTLEKEEDGLAGVVVGLPVSLTGQAHSQTQYVLRFVESLRNYTELPIYVQDERLSSHEAESRLAEHERDWRQRKARLDAASAAVILQDFLDSQPDLKTSDRVKQGG
jgi:putative Holliday junction resolvase